MFTTSGQVFIKMGEALFGIRVFPSSAPVFDLQLRGPSVPADQSVGMESI